MKTHSSANDGIKQQDYYTLLKVDRFATPDEIKSAYHKIMNQLRHNHHDGIDNNLSELNQAYDVLHDPTRRASYDQGLMDVIATGMTTIPPLTNQHRRSQLPQSLRVPWGIWIAILFIILFYVAQVVIGLGLLAGGYLFGPTIGRHFVTFLSSGDITSTFVLSVLTDAVGFFIMWLIIRRYHVPWRTLGFRRFKLSRAFTYIITIYAGFFVLSALVLFSLSVLIPSFNPNQAQSNGFISGAHSDPWLALVGLVILPPILEETMFRGFIFPAFAGRFGVIWGAIISSFLFGLAHFQANVSVYTFLLGLLLCYMYTKLKSTIPGMALHATNNLIAYMALTHVK